MLLTPHDGLVEAYGTDTGFPKIAIALRSAIGAVAGAAIGRSQVLNDEKNRRDAQIMVELFRQQLARRNEPIYEGFRSGALIPAGTGVGEYTPPELVQLASADIEKEAGIGDVVKGVGKSLGGIAGSIGKGLKNPVGLGASVRQGANQVGGFLQNRAQGASSMLGQLKGKLMPGGMPTMKPPSMPGLKPPPTHGSLSSSAAPKVTPAPRAAAQPPKPTLSSTKPANGVPPPGTPADTSQKAPFQPPQGVSPQPVGQVPATTPGSPSGAPVTPTVQSAPPPVQQPTNPSPPSPTPVATANNPSAPVQQAAKQGPAVAPAQQAQQGDALTKAWERTGLANNQWKTKLPMLAAGGLGAYGLYRGAQAGFNWLGRESHPNQWGNPYLQPAASVNEWGIPQR